MKLFSRFYLYHCIFFVNSRYFSAPLFALFVWIMPLRCRHTIKKSSSLYYQDKLQKNRHIHLTNSALTSEPQFESWTPVESDEQQQPSSDHPSLHRTSPGEHHSSH